MYIGEAASLSFLQLVRSIVADQIGPSQFSHNDQSETMLEKESPRSARNISVPRIADLDVETRLVYWQCFNAVVSNGRCGLLAPQEL